MAEDNPNVGGRVDREEKVQGRLCCYIQYTQLSKVEYRDIYIPGEERQLYHDSDLVPFCYKAFQCSLFAPIPPNFALRLQQASIAHSAICQFYKGIPKKVF